MNSRRSFFKSLAKAAVIVALAPQLAFRAKPIVWRQTDEGIHDLLVAMDRNNFRQLPSFYDFIMAQKPYTAEELRDAPLSYLANQDGPKINRISEHKLRELFRC